MDPIADLILSFTKFPGVGNKSARRMVFYLLKRDSAELQDLGRRIATLKDELCVCSRCGNVSSGDPCPICSDALRDRETLCVVEDIDDLEAVAGRLGAVVVLRQVRTGETLCNHDPLRLAAAFRDAFDGVMGDVAWTRAD